MAVPDGFTTYCCELLSAVGEARSKRMFGGYGVYVDDLFVAIIVGDTLYLKADEQTQPQFAAAGGQRFEYTVRGSKKHSMGYWTVPEEAMDSPHLMASWARLAVEAARRAADTKRIQTRRPKR